MKRIRPLLAAAALGLLALPAQSAEPAAAPSASAGRERHRPKIEELRRRGEGVLQRLKARDPQVEPAPSAEAAPSAASSAEAAGSGELARRWHRHLATRLERRERHRAELVKTVGTRLADARVRDELRLHATRASELTRLRFLAENSRSGSARDKLLARIAKLSDREHQRHEARLASLLREGSRPSASASAPRPAAAPASAGAKP